MATTGREQKQEMEDTKSSNPFFSSLKSTADILLQDLNETTYFSSSTMFLTYLKVEARQMRCLDFGKSRAGLRSGRNFV